jgi:transposase
VLPLDEALVARVLGVLPPPAARGRPRVAPPQILGGIVWVMRTGSAWRYVPPAFGPWETVHSRYRLWRQDGTWDRIAPILSAAADRAPAA